MIPRGIDPGNQLRDVRVNKDGDLQMVAPPSGSQVVGGMITWQSVATFEAQLFSEVRQQDWVLSSTGTSALTADYSTDPANVTHAAVILPGEGLRLQCGTTPGNKTVFRTLLPLPLSVMPQAGPFWVTKLPEGLPAGYRVLYGLLDVFEKNGYLWELTGVDGGQPTARAIIRKSTGPGPLDFDETPVELTDKLDGSGPSGAKVYWEAPNAVYGKGSLAAPIATDYMVGDVLALRSRLVESQAATAKAGGNPLLVHTTLPNPVRLGMALIVENIAQDPTPSIAQAIAIECAYQRTSGQPFERRTSTADYTPVTPPALPAAEQPIFAVRHEGVPGTLDLGVWPEKLTVITDGNGSGIVRVYEMLDDSQAPTGAVWAPVGDGVLEFASPDTGSTFGAETPPGTRIARKSVIGKDTDGRTIDLARTVPMGTGYGYNTAKSSKIGIVVTLERVSGVDNLISIEFEGARPR